MQMLDAAAQGSIDAEEELFSRTRRAIELAASTRAAQSANPSEPARARLRELREQAINAQADDLPDLLLQLSVEQRLAQREPELLPDPRCPYVAHLRVREGKLEKDYLLGAHTFVAPDQGIRIIDWRVAPVARIFYGYRAGDEYEEEFPGRVAEGVVLVRRIVVFEQGELCRILDHELQLERRPGGVWRNVARARLDEHGAGQAARPGVLGTGAGSSERAAHAEITALLDAEQFAAVSAPARTPLLVLGSAGSGKTTVALHRLSHVRAREPQSFALERSRVVVPEPGLARLSQRLLEPLLAGSEWRRTELVQTLDEWASELSRRTFGQRSALSNEAPGVVVSLKRHPALFRALSTRFVKPRKPSSLKRLRLRLGELLTDREFLAGVVRDANGDLPLSAIAETTRHTMNLLRDPFTGELAAITDPARRRALDGRAITDGTPDALAGTLDLEDLPILLYLRSLEASLPARELRQLVIDEAEDLSLFELSVLGQQLAEEHSVTLAGDEAQQTSSSFAGWERALATLGVKDAALCRLSVSYRCPLPVVELSRHLLGELAPDEAPRAARDGAPIGYHGFPSPAQAHLFLGDAVRDLLEREPRAAVAVIAQDAAAARAVFSVLGQLPGARLVLEGDFSFEPGVDVTDVDSVKGLEFDYVIVPDATAEAYPDEPEARRRLHVATTRTAHQLWLLAGGPPSPLVKERFAD